MFSKRRTSGFPPPLANPDEVPANMEDVQSGYMYKSPLQTILFKSLKSWKRRFFVLSKTSVNYYQLRFFKDGNKREKPLGQINLYQVSLLFRQAESHPNCQWIQRNFRCTPSCVLYMKVPDREYFLIGQNSDEMDEWFNAIFKALNTHVPTPPDSEEIRKFRSISEPTSMLYRDQNGLEDQEQKETDPNPSFSMRQSAPESFNQLVYDYPRNYMMTAFTESEDSEEDEEDDVKINKESEIEGHTNHYMDMKSVEEALRQTEDLLLPQTNLEGNNSPENLFLQTGNEESSTALNGQISSGSESPIPVEEEIYVSQHELKNSVIISEEAGKLWVSNWKHTQSSVLFHEGDQILAINDLLTDSLGELQSYLKRLAKDQVKLTILRQPGSQPLSGCYT
ncbi:pleckstrin homology domain-containing family S member 1 isoform X1 [Ictalurus punctatus]|uniref:Pleckstrin homology domain-containing family S member 1 isoform X1 n=1 Tax=Ictalurus punctatus TaxID=7998 RepID=A0A2D0S7D8_ICTPU|nr:pleckstrin homology domain-containing family S member 1 isoform X1 [Ictalurus punctatus]XP_017338659.1 pleckstrin homology domain-containing family S member 1 isoform X1 [Ictalurus punctatus]